MNWEKIECKWAEVTSRMWADTRVQRAKGATAKPSEIQALQDRGDRSSEAHHSAKGAAKN